MAGAKEMVQQERKGTGYDADECDQMEVGNIRTRKSDRYVRTRYV